MYDQASYIEDFRRGFNAAEAPADAPAWYRALYARAANAPKFELDVASAALPSRYGIAGAGLMGCTIAASFLHAGLAITLYDPIEEARAAAPQRIKTELLTKYERPDVDAALARLTVVATIEELAKEEVVVETIPEKLNLKKKFYKTLAAAATAPILLLTNTSSLRITDLAQGLADDATATICQERFAAFHFFHPVAKRGLVEIAPCPKTSSATLSRAAALAERIAKTPLVVADGPGLLVNRLLQAYLNEALLLLDSEIDAERLERVCRDIGFDGPPLRAIDEIGVDVSMHAGYSFLKAFPERTYSSTVLPGLIREGRLGRKTQRGFYRYDSRDSWADDATLDADAQTLERLRDAAFESVPATMPESKKDQTDAWLADAILQAIYDEGRRLLEEGVASTPREVDAALVLALGFPKRLGGVFFSRAFDESRAENTP